MTDAFLPEQGDLIESDVLNVFCWVARTSNFSRAAVRLGTAQPVVTRKIGRLEEDLGVELFVRTNRGCKLTQAGELLASKAPGILAQIAQLKEEVAHSAQVISGSLSMGITHSAGSVMAPHLLLPIAARWPRLHVNLVEALSKNLVEQVLRQELSLAVLYDPPAHPDLVATPLLMERLYLVGSPRARMHKSGRPSVQDLVGLPLVLPSGHQTIRVLLEDAFAEIGEPLTPVYEASSVNMLRAMAAEGLGYTILTLCSAAADVAAGKLVAQPLADAGMSVALTMITTREHARLRNVQLMADFVAGEIRSVAKRGLWPGKPTVVR